MHHPTLGGRLTTTLPVLVARDSDRQERARSGIAGWKEMALPVAAPSRPRWGQQLLSRRWLPLASLLLLLHLSCSCVVLNASTFRYTSFFTTNCVASSASSVLTLAAGDGS